MTLIKEYLSRVDMLPFKRKGKRYVAVLEDLDLLLHSGCQACEIDISPYKNANTARACYYNATKRYGVFDKVQVTLRSVRLFLVRKEVSEKC